MEDIYYTLGELVDLWKLPTSSGFESESVVATEFWLQKATNTIKVKTRKIGPEARERWLDERTKGSGEDEQSLLVRFVWLVADNNRNEITLSQSIRHILLERFGLRLAGEYFKTLSSGVADLPPVSKPEFDQRAYTFSYGPKIAAIWSHSIFKGSSAGESVTEGLIFTRGRSEDPSKNSKQKSKPGKDPLQELQGFLQRAPWKPELCRSSAFPAYLFSIMLSRQMTETQTEIAGSIRQVESRTGHHKYANREDHDENHLGKLSASTSGYASKLASVMRKGQVVQKLLDFIKKTVNEEAALEERYGTHSGDGEPNFGTGSLLKANVEVLQDRLEMQRVEVEHTLKRVEIQIEAVGSLTRKFEEYANWCW